MKPAPRKLTPVQVQEIREAVRLREDLRKRASRLSNAALADRLGVHVRTVDRITAGENWGWLD